MRWKDETIVDTKEYRDAKFMQRTKNAYNGEQTENQAKMKISLFRGDFLRFVVLDVGWTLGVLGWLAHRWKMKRETKKKNTKTIKFVFLFMENHNGLKCIACCEPIGPDEYDQMQSLIDASVENMLFIRPALVMYCVAPATTFICLEHSRWVSISAHLVMKCRSYSEWWRWLLQNLRRGWNHRYLQLLLPQHLWGLLH